MDIRARIFRLWSSGVSCSHATALCFMVFCVLSALVGVAPVMGDTVTIPPEQRRAISAHGVCRQVSNLNPHPVMIPIRTPDEWSAGLSSFLSAARQGMIVTSCPKEIWAWEYMNGTMVVWQGPSQSDYEAGGLEVQTRFTQYTGSPSSVVNTIPACGPSNAGARITIIEGRPGSRALYMQHVCNNATQVDPFTIQNFTVPAASWFGTQEFTLTGIPHTRTEQFLVGVAEAGWQDPNGGCCAFNYDSRIVVNGVAYIGGNNLVIGRIDPNSPYYPEFLSTYGGAGVTSNGQPGPVFGVAVRNGDRVRISLRATRQAGVTLRYFVKIGQYITYFSVTTT